MLRVIFLGTPDFSVPTLSEIIGAGHEVVAVYTRAPKIAGRGMNERKSPVHEFAESAGIPVMTPKSLKGEPEQAAIRALNADIAVVIAYGLILPKSVLDAPRLGCLNLHGSALPRWRGAAPIQRAIMAGDTETAAMVMQMDEGLDTGPVCLAERIPIDLDMTAGELHDRMAALGASLMVRALAAAERGSLTATPQPAEGVTYASKIEKSETRIDFAKPATEVHNHVRGLSPFPGAWLETAGSMDAGISTTIAKPERIKVLRSTLAAGSGAPGTVLDDHLTIACGSGAVRLLEVQRAGKKPMSAAELLRGFSLRPGLAVG